MFFFKSCAILARASGWILHWSWSVRYFNGSHIFGPALTYRFQQPSSLLVCTIRCRIGSEDHVIKLVFLSEPTAFYLTLNLSSCRGERDYYLEVFFLKRLFCQKFPCHFIQFSIPTRPLPGRLALPYHRAWSASHRYTHD